MPDRSAIERGIAFEQRVVTALGLTASPGSGNTWQQKGDGQGGGIRVSSKSTSGRTWAQTRAHLREAIEMCAGTGDLPALAIEDEDGAELVVMRLEDLAALREGGTLPERKPKRGDVVRDLSMVPALLRD